MKAIKKAGFICALYFIIQFIGLPEVQAKDDSFALENDYVSFCFNPKTFGLISMVDKITGAGYVYNDVKEAMMWQLEFKMGTNSTGISNKISSPVAEHQVLPDGSQLLSITWTNIRWWRNNNFATVHVTISLPKDSGIAIWRIDVDNHDDLWGLWAVKFPYIDGFLKSGEYNVAVPGGNGGINFRNLAGPITRRYPSGPWPAQFLCGTKGSDSFYLSAMDPDSRVKEFSINPGKEFFLTLYPEGMGVAGSDSPDKFPYAFGVYQGNWEKACKIYRVWALNQRWTASGPLLHRDDVPGILKNMGMWLQMSNEVENNKDNTRLLVSEIKDANVQLDVPIGVHWYNWHQMPFDNKYPYFFPGRPEIRGAFKDLVGKGFLIMPYINGMIADYDNSDIKYFLPYSTKDETGVPRLRLWGTQSGRMVIMCPTQKFWHDKILAVVDTLYREYGVNGVYIDQISAHPAELCFDKTHGHSIGGGNYWVEGFRGMLSKIRDYSVPRGLVITSEDTGEPYIDQIDAFLTWATIGEDLPMMEMVYSGYTLYFGSRAENLPDGIFHVIEGRAFLWGHQNGWMSPWYLKEGHEKKAAFMKKIGKYRIATRHFLTYGELSELIKPTNSVPVIQGNYNSNDGNTRKFEYPEVMGSVWKSEDGRIGVYMANFTEKENMFQFVLDLKKYSNARKFKVYQIDEDGRRVYIRQLDSSVHVFSESIESFGIRVLELEP